MKYICSHANVALNLQPKTVEPTEPASASTAAGEAAGNREHKIRKTDDDSKMNAPLASMQDEKMELSAQSTNVESKASEDWSKAVQGNSNESKQEEKMEMDSHEDDNDDIGEIHIVSIRLEF